MNNDNNILAINAIKYLTFLAVSLIGLVVFFGLMILLQVNRVETANAQSDVLRGEVVDIEDGILVIKLEEMDEQPMIDVGSLLEFYVINDYPQPETTPVCKFQPTELGTPVCVPVQP